MARRPLRINFVLPYAGIAGGIRVIAIYAQRLQQRGHHVHVVSTQYQPPGRMARARGYVQSALHRIRPSGPNSEPSHFNGLDIPHVQLPSSRIRDKDVPDGDIVIATWWETAATVAALSRSKGAKCYFVQDYGAHHGQPMERVAESWKLPLHKIVISRYLMNLIVEHTGETEQHYVPNAVDHSQFHAPPRRKNSIPTVGFVYNPAPQKGCDTIVRAIELARAAVPALRVIAFGPGNPASNTPLPLNTDFRGCVADSQLREIYSSCDAWLFASRSEGFGLPILESMACRTPVIGTPAGAAPELLGEGGGLLVPFDDPNAMAAAIVRIASMREATWLAMSDAALCTASKYTWDDATTLFESTLYSAMNEDSSSIAIMAKEDRLAIPT